MSRSPSDRAEPRATQDYQQAWDELSELIRRGASFSGHERNCAFLNLGHGPFANISSVSGIDFADDGRALGVVDVDVDGDLDVWVSNRTGPQLRLLRNRLPGERHFLQLRLHGRKSNRDAVGARAELRLPSGTTLVRVVRSGEGFIAQSSKVLHFGLGEHDTVAGLSIRWPSGLVQELAVPQVDRRWELFEGDEQLSPWTRPGSPLSMPAYTEPAGGTDPTHELADDTTSDGEPRGSRLFLAGRMPLPVCRPRDADGETLELDRLPGRPRLLVLWASWCQPCLAELKSLVRARDQLEASGLDVLAMSTDAADGAGDGLTQARAALERLEFPWPSVYADSELLARLELALRHLSDRWRPLGVPTSLLLDRQGWIAAVYFGPVEVEQVLADAQRVDLDPVELKAHAVPWPGRWSYSTYRVDLAKLAGEMLEKGSPADYLRYLEADFLWYQRLGENASEADVAAARNRLVEALERSARDALAEGRPHEAASAFAQLHKLAPDDADIWNNWGTTLGLSGQWEQAAHAFREACRRNPSHREATTNLAGALERLGDSAAAASQYEAIVAVDPQARTARNNLAWLRATHADERLRRPDEATRLAEDLCRETDFRHPGYLDTLAAAYAAQGRYDRASDVAARAVELARSDQPQLSAAIAGRLELYRQRRAYVAQREQNRLSPAAAASPTSEP